MNGNIYTAISNIMTDVGAVGKDGYNAIQKFKFRGIDDVMNALYPALTKHHVFVVPEVLEQNREERQTSKGGLLIYSICKIKFTFYADDGSSISAITIGEGMDSGDKATNKAMSIAFKYACFQVFCIPTEEMKDPDADSPEPAPRRQNIDLRAMEAEMQRTGVEVGTILKSLKIKTIEQMSESQYHHIMQRLSKTPNKEAKHE